MSSTMFNKTNGLDYYSQRFAIVARTNFFEKAKEEYVQALRKLGFEAQSFCEFEEMSDYHPTCCIVIGPHLYEMPSDKSVIWVAIQTEQLYSPVLGGDVRGKALIRSVLRRIDGYDILVDFQEESAEYFKQFFHKRILVYRSPVDKVWVDQADDPVIAANEKKYDLIFIGTSSNTAFPRRKAILDFLSQRYSLYPECTGLWGEKRDQAIRESRICLNLHYEESMGFEGDRLNHYFRNGGFVLSERMHDPFPYVEHEDFETFYLTDICEKIDYYLQHEEERNRIAQIAHKKQKMLCREERYKVLVDAVLVEAYHRYVEGKKSKGIVNKLKKIRHGICMTAYRVTRSLGLSRLSKLFLEY